MRAHKTGFAAALRCSHVTTTCRTPAPHCPTIVACVTLRGSTESLNRVKEITGKTDADVDFFEADILDGTALEEVFKAHTYESCVHFAALKAVGESVALPLKYYKNNLSGTFQLLETMQKYGCKRIGAFLGAGGHTRATRDRPATQCCWQPLWSD